MVEKLSEVDLKNELEDSIYLLVNCMYFLGLEGHVKKMVGGGERGGRKLEGFRFLYQFGNEVERPDAVREFFGNILKEKVAIKKVLKNFSFCSYQVIFHYN
jgi:hypothetical protein